MTDPARFGEGFDAVVVGAGPNGLSAGIELAQAGKRVLVLEGEETIGGGSRTLELTLPGFLHDPCSAIHPLALASPFFQTLPLASYGLSWAEPPIAMAHPFDDGTAATLMISLDETARLEAASHKCTDWRAPDTGAECERIRQRLRQLDAEGHAAKARLEQLRERVRQLGGLW